MYGDATAEAIRPAQCRYQSLENDSLAEFRGDAGFTGPGILGLIAFAALIGALKAVWNK
jgi:hypothetical protein